MSKLPHGEVKAILDKYDTGKRLSRKELLELIKELESLKYDDPEATAYITRLVDAGIKHIKDIEAKGIASALAKLPEWVDTKYLADTLAGWPIYADPKGFADTLVGLPDSVLKVIVTDPSKLTKEDYQACANEMKARIEKNPELMTLLEELVELFLQEPTLLPYREEMAKKLGIELPKAKKEPTIDPYEVWDNPSTNVIIGGTNHIFQVF